MDRHIVQNRIGYLLVQLWRRRKRRRGKERWKREKRTERKKGAVKGNRERSQDGDGGRGCREWV